MNSQTQFHLFPSSPPREGSPEQRNADVQTDFTPRSLSLISSHSQYQHKADCEARPQSEDLEDFKSLARAWYLTCQANPGKELWNINYAFFFKWRLSKTKGIFYLIPDAFATNIPRPEATSSRHFLATARTPAVLSEADLQGKETVTKKINR